MVFLVLKGLTGHLFLVLEGLTDPQDRVVGYRKGNNYSCQKIAQNMQGNPLITACIFSWELLLETRAKINVTRLFVRLSVTLVCVTDMKARISLKIFFNKLPSFARPNIYIFVTREYTCLRPANFRHTCPLPQ